MHRHSLSEINSLPRAEFVRLLGPVFEQSPWIAEAAWAKRPFPNREALRATVCQIVADAGPVAQLALIRAHPDLGGRLAQAGQLTAQSQGEQARAGLDRLSPAEIAWFQDRNAAYRRRFGFPFVICARLNNKDAIVRGFQERLQNPPAAEVKTALEEIYKIADLRLRDLASD